MTSTSITTTRAALISHIIATLEPHGFNRDDHVFEVTRYMVRPGSRVIINGRVFDEEPMKIPFAVRIELLGPGSIISPDGREEHFELIHFGIRVNDEIRGEAANVYYGHHLEFNKHLSNYFKFL